MNLEDFLIPPSPVEEFTPSNTNALSQETLNKVFFDEYVLHYNKFIDHLNLSASGQLIFNGDQRTMRHYCKKLFFRILFLCFVQKKGWLGASDTTYKDGMTDFLSHFFKASIHNEEISSSSFNGFFFALNKKRINDDFIMPDGNNVRVPFLGMSLFEPDEYDRHTIIFKASLLYVPGFANIVPTEKNNRGLLDFLDSFQFSLCDPSEHAASIGPGMLAYVFENLSENNKTRGVYYTPADIVQYMCHASLIEYLLTGLDDADLKYEGIASIVKDKDPGKLTPFQLKQVHQLLDSVKICDPAIGSGAFTMGMLQEITAIKKMIAYQQKTEWDAANIKRYIIKENIYGADIDKDAVKINYLRFWLSVAADEKDPGNLLPLDNNIAKGDSLLSEVLDSCLPEGEGFDIVIANPPYIGQKGNKTIFAQLNTDPDFETKMDYWYFFLHKAYSLTKKGGVNTFITPNYWTTARGAKKMRQKVVGGYRIVEYINFNDNAIFDAGVHTNIFVLKKGEEPNPEIKCTIYENKYSENIFSYRDTELNFYTNQNTILSPWTGFIHFLPANISAIINQLIVNCEKLSDDESIGESVKGVIPGKKVTNGICSIAPGIESGRDKGIFVLTKDEVEALDLDDNEKNFVKRFYKNSDIGKYSVDGNSDSYFLYVNSIESEDEFTQYKNLYAHFTAHKKELGKRARNGVLESAYKRGKWWALKTDRPNINWAAQKIVCPQRSRENKFALADETFLSSVDIYYISKNSAEYDLKYILAILNSSVIYTWLYWMGKRKGEMLELYFEPLQFIPVKKISLKEQTPFATIVDYIIYLKENKLPAMTQQIMLAYFEQLIDGMVYELYFPELLKKDNGGIIMHLGNLPELTDKMSDEEKTDIIKTVFIRLGEKAHPVKLSLFDLTSIKERLV